MKKITCILLVIFSIFSCVTEEKLLTFSEENTVFEGSIIVETNIPVIMDESEVAKNINSIVNSFVINAINPDSNNDALTIKDAAKGLDDDYKSFSEKLDDDSQPWEAFVDGEVTFQSSEILSMAFNTYLNTGGAHGNSIITFLNFNPVSGRLYKKEDFIEYLNEFKTLAKKHFEKAITEEGEALNDSEFKLPEAIGFSDEGVILVYNTYELADYSLKLLEFTIPFEELGDALQINPPF